MVEQRGRASWTEICVSKVWGRQIIIWLLSSITPSSKISMGTTILSVELEKNKLLCNNL